MLAAEVGFVVPVACFEGGPFMAVEGCLVVPPVCFEDGPFVVTSPLVGLLALPPDVVCAAVVDGFALPTAGFVETDRCGCWECCRAW